MTINEVLVSITVALVILGAIVFLSTLIAIAKGKDRLYREKYEEFQNFKKHVEDLLSKK